MLTVEKLWFDFVRPAALKCVSMLSQPVIEPQCHLLWSSDF